MKILNLSISLFFLFFTFSAMAEDQMIKVKVLPPQDEMYDYSGVIEVTPSKKFDCIGCFEVSYNGTLYSGCSNACSAQGYRVLLDSKGNIVTGEKAKDVTKNDLMKFDPIQSSMHSPLSSVEFDRLMKITNNPKDIEDIYEITKEAKNYAAQISSGPKGKGVFSYGNTTATFVTHITMARRELINQNKIKGDWQDYSGIFPGFPKTPKVGEQETGKASIYDGFKFKELSDVPVKGETNKKTTER